MTKRVLVIYYSQSGDMTRLAEAFTRCLDRPDVELTWERIEPEVHYPYPWGLYRLFDVFPECINGEPPEIRSPKFPSKARFDLIILAYQVWFLAPSLPVQAFLRSRYAEVLRDTKVITLVGCRNMWHSASRTMKAMIAEAGGVQVDNVVLTHQGSPLATFVTTPAMLLTGRKQSLPGVLPPAGFRDEDIEALSRFGRRIAENLDALGDRDAGPMLKGLGAVEVNQRYVIPELIGYTLYRRWARLVRFFGGQGSRRRAPIIWIFAVQLVVAIPIVLVVSALVRVTLAPLLSRKMASYIDLLKSPSGTA